MPRQERRVVRAVGFVPVESKLRHPTPREGLVGRGELVDRLRESAGIAVVLLTAPAGYGKTVLMRQWADEDPRPFARLSLDENDNDPVVLVTYLMLALQQIEPVDPGALMSLTGGHVSVDTVMLPRLGRIMRRRTRPFVLVLDAADALTDPAAVAVVSTLAAHLPDGSQLAVVGREPPQLPWHNFRAEGRLVELDAADLALSETESRALLAAAGLELPSEDFAALYEATEGWAAGLYLAARSLSSSSARRDALMAFAAEDSGVSEYLHGELLSSLPEDQQTFLTRIAILDRMCGPLCDALLATTGSGKELQHLAGANLFLVPLDHDKQWYRFHHLFRDMLRAEQQRREPRLARKLHSRASRWFEENGYVDEAIEHAHDAGEVDRAASLLWADTSSILANDSWNVLERRIQSFTSDQVIARTHLAMAAAWDAIGRGRPVAHWVSAAELGRYEATGSDSTESVTAGLALLRAAMATHGTAHMTVDARLALHLLAQDDPWRSAALFLEGAGLHLTGHREAGVAALEMSERLAEALHLHAIRSMALAQLAFVAVEDHDWRRAEELNDAATILLKEHGLANVPTAGLVSCMATLVMAKRGLVEEAAVEARHALGMIAVTTNVAPWLAVESRYLLGRAELTMGDTAAARSFLSEAQTFMSATADAVVLSHHLDDAWQQVEQSPLGHGGGLSTLTTAELRVLQYLPTHLSFEQISERLFVSRNTVKTQAIAAYRKLGVTSRSDAVERAFALGLVQR